MNEWDPLLPPLADTPHIPSTPWASMWGKNKRKATNQRWCVSTVILNQFISNFSANNTVSLLQRKFSGQLITTTMISKSAVTASRSRCELCEKWLISEVCGMWLEAWQQRTPTDTQAGDTGTQEVERHVCNPSTGPALWAQEADVVHKFTIEQ